MTDAAAASLPRSFLLLIGPPRSGTTLIANTFMAHSAVTGVIEPYQRRRNHETLGATDLAGFLAENPNPGAGARPHLAVKETTTRLQNARMSLALMRSAAAHGLYTGLVLILRCPFSAFLSQVEASREMWREKKMTETTPEALRRWTRGQKQSLKLLTDHARAQHFRIVSYEAFCAAPRAEMARLMALVPARLEPAQMTFTAPRAVRPGGDPKTRENAGQIAFSDRSGQIGALSDMLGPGPDRRFLNEWRAIVRDRVCHEPDQVTLDRLSRLLA